MNSSNDDIIYVSDFSNSAIRRCDSTDAIGTQVTTLLNGLESPVGLVFSLDLKYLFCSSANLNYLYKIQISTGAIIVTYGSGEFY